MVQNNRKRALAVLMTLLVSCVAFAQNPARVDFSLRSIDGQTVTSNSLRGEVVADQAGDLGINGVEGSGDLLIDLLGELVQFELMALAGAEAAAAQGRSCGCLY